MRSDELGPEALLISGTVGAGKTTAAEAVGELLRGQDIAHAVIDLDWLRAGWPSPPADPFNSAVELANLSCVAANYLQVGARRLILAGVLEDPSFRGRYQKAVHVPLKVARLRADLHLIDARLRRRHEGQDASLEWHLTRAAELDRILESSRCEDFLVESSGLDPRRTAIALLGGAGWDVP